MAVIPQEKIDRSAPALPLTGISGKSSVLFAASTDEQRLGSCGSFLAYMLVEAVARVLRHELVQVDRLEELPIAVLVEEPISAIIISIERGSVDGAVSVCRRLSFVNIHRPVVIALNLSRLSDEEADELAKVVDYMVDSLSLEAVYRLIKRGSQR